ncbi:MAG: peptidoglycan DD-metalloendopeptidase family protein [Bacteroidales bacterium]|nr:peptidoglycan DD-metalloendopeptidase family protein [Bacteroidales bacterium]
MKISYIRALVCVSIFFNFQFSIFNSAQAQSKQQLEKDRAQVEQEIKKLNADLGKAKKNSKNSQRQLQLLEEKIKQRTRLINNINGQLNMLDIQMSQTQDSITLMRSQVDSMKREYAHVVRVLYGERDALDKLVLLLDTKSYNTAYLRTKYFRDYSRYRRRQAAFIRQKEEELNEVGVQLARQQQETTSLLAQERRQKDQLSQERKEHQQSLDKSKQKEKLLQQQIDKKEKQKRQLQQQIQKIINEEIAKAQKEKKAAAGAGAGKSSSASTADVALSNDFASNKGRLPWPVFYTKVLREYGKYTHASGGQNMNSGIDLQCKSGTSVQAVFGGTVSRVFTCPNGTKGIIVRHGDYMTVYANMGTVAVKEGAKVGTKQNLGTVYTNDEGVGEFSFQLWKGTTSQNPRSWLR